MKGHFTKDLLFEDWSQELANKIKSKPQIKNQWKIQEINLVQVF